MKKPELDRRDFIKGAVVGGAAAAGTTLATPDLRPPPPRKPPGMSFSISTKPLSSRAW
jgi:hypothetical protein